MTTGSLSKKLEVFKGRVCTVLTGPTGLHITDPVRHAQFFTGRVVDVDDQGIWLQHLTTKSLAFFMYPFAGIVEEQVIADSDPRAAKLKEEMDRKAKPVSPCCGGPKTDFLPIEELTRAVKEGKKAMAQPFPTI